MLAVILRALREVVRAGHLAARALLWRDFTPFVRVHFLASAAESGVLRALREPLTANEVAERVGIQRLDLLEALLALGVALGELERRRERYSLRGRRARLVADDRGDAFAALVEEWMHYDGVVFRDLAPRIRGGPPGDYLTATAAIVARSSRVLEPFVAAYLREVIEHCRPRRVLDVGCGSAVYLRYAATPGVSGVGIDVDPRVVEQARANLARWGIADRFEIVEGDIRAAADALRGPFDLVMLLNNVYYFAPDERTGLFVRLRSLLAAGGALVVVSATEGSTVAITAFDLVLRSTAGCWPVPERAALESQLHASGFANVRRDEIAPGQSLDAFLAS